MRLIFVFLALSVAAWPQAMTEAAAAAAGGTVGGVAGKKVGEGVGNILEKVAASAAKAADGKQTKATPVLEVGPGVPKTATTAAASTKPASKPVSSKPAVARVARDRSLVPPPPPPAHPAVAKEEPPAAPQEVVQVIAPPPPPPPAPPPEVTANDLKTLSNGMGRLAVLKLGPPASRVTMAEAGHLVEVYRYASRDRSLGVVRLSDGVVSSIEIHP